jgi:hypothetical protein
LLLPDGAAALTADEDESAETLDVLEVPDESVVAELLLVVAAASVLDDPVLSGGDDEFGAALLPLSLACTCGFPLGLPSLCGLPV